MRPPQTADAGVARTFQNLALFANLSVIDNLMLGRHHLMKTGADRRCALVGAGPARGDRPPPPLRRDHGPARPRRLPAPPGRHPALRHPEADRARARPGHGPDPPAPRRAGGRHEPRRDRGHGRPHQRDPGGARRGDHPRRAPDGPRDGPRRPVARAGLRPRGDGRVAERHPERPARHRRLRGGRRHDRARTAAARAAWWTMPPSPEDCRGCSCAAPRSTPTHVALRHNERSRWRELTWEEYATRTAHIGLGLRRAGRAAG